MLYAFIGKDILSSSSKSFNISGTLYLKQYLKFQEMQERCEGRKSCEVAASNNVFGDPCFGVEKYLTSTWECVPGQMTLAKQKVVIIFDYLIKSVFLLRF